MNSDMQILIFKAIIMIVALLVGIIDLSLLVTKFNIRNHYCIEDLRNYVIVHTSFMLMHLIVVEFFLIQYILDFSTYLRSYDFIEHILNLANLCLWCYGLYSIILYSCLLYTSDAADD